MSLFKERAVNAKKLISLENTIIALKKQLASLSNSSDELKKLQDTIDLLKKENSDLKKQLEAASVKEEPKKRPGRRKASKPSTQED